MKKWREVLEDHERFLGKTETRPALGTAIRVVISNCKEKTKVNQDFQAFCGIKVGAEKKNDWVCIAAAAVYSNYKQSSKSVATLLLKHVVCFPACPLFYIIKHFMYIFSELNPG